jgi:trehalose 2-sulfotransferase
MKSCGVYDGVVPRNYIVAATPRTGSSLLCEGLCATGIAGNPAEVFAPDFRHKWFRHWGLPSGTTFKQYVSTAIGKGRTDNGVFALKIQWMHVALLAHELTMRGEDCDVLERLFPESQFINVVRRDRLAQALSWHRAIVTNVWWKFQAGKDSSNGCEVTLDTSAVDALVEEIVRQQSAWENYFRKSKRRVLVVEYESLDKDYRGEVARALQFLGLDASAARRIPEPRLMRQADSLNVQWRRQMHRARKEMQP